MLHLSRNAVSRHSRIFDVHRMIRLQYFLTRSRPVNSAFVARIESCASPDMDDSLEFAIDSTSSIRTHKN